MTKASSHGLHIKLLRPLVWIEMVGAEEGGTFFLELPEMGAVGDAHVEAILPCPPIEQGPGNVVTGVFTHEAAPDTRILSVTLSNGTHLKGVTDNHPFWSVGHNRFVEVGKMHEGDFVKIEDGVTCIARIESRFAGPGEMLYNLETHNEHVYQVTTAGILVHNSCAEIVGDIARKFGRFECKQCANAMADALKAKGIRGHLVKLHAPSAHGGRIVSDRLGGRLISETSEHWGVRVGGRVYDTLNPKGIAFKDWFRDFHAHGGIRIQEILRF
jgi:hypothetical protein